MIVAGCTHVEKVTHAELDNDVLVQAFGEKPAAGGWQQRAYQVPARTLANPIAR